MKNGWLKLAVFSLVGILGIGVLQLLFQSFFTSSSMPATTGSGMSQGMSGGGGMGMGMMSGGGMGMMGGSGMGMMSGGGMGMMGGSGMGMMGGGGMGGMSSSGSFLGSFFSLVLTLFIILAVIGLIAGLIGLAVSYFKKNPLPSLTNKITTTKDTTEVIVPKDVVVDTK